MCADENGVLLGTRKRHQPERVKRNRTEVR